MENNYLKLADIPTGEECVIVKVHGHGSFRNRIVEMGFVKGEKVTVIKNAPLHDPIEYKLMDGHISLRRSEARLIEVVCTSSIDQEGYNGTFTEDEIAREISEKSRTINIALVGNPNCGKTSFFNRNMLFLIAMAMERRNFMCSQQDIITYSSIKMVLCSYIKIYHLIRITML